MKVTRKPVNNFEENIRGKPKKYNQHLNQFRIYAVY